MTPTSQTDHPRFSDLQLEVHIEAQPDVVWKALTADIGEWWPSEFYCGSGTGTARCFKLDARPGGRMWEDWGSGDGLLWGTVVNVVAGRTLDLTGTLGPSWGGPNTWFGGFQLEPDGKSTRLRFSESAFGRIADSATAEKEKGWQFLLGTLRAHVEGTESPTWED